MFEPQCTCWQVLPAEALPVDLHTRVAQALRVLKAADMFKKDAVWVNGKLSVTRVSRSLLGEPGLTYVFSGLVMWRFRSSLAGTHSCERALFAKRWRHL